MGRERNQKRDEALRIYLESKGGITNREISRQLDVPEKTISAWKSRDKWSVVLQSVNCSTTKKRGVHPGNQFAKGHGAPKGNQNAKGNPGNKRASPPKRNSNALKHGFFAKYLPEETLAIITEIQELPPLDLLWDQIMIQYTAIIRAQRIMNVSSQDDITRELKREKSGDSGWEQEFEIQFAWDKHATFLNSQSRAMSELRAMVKQFVELSNETDERRLKLQQMQLNIDKTRAVVDSLTGKAVDAKDAIQEFLDATKPSESELKELFSDVEEE